MPRTRAAPARSTPAVSEADVELLSEGDMTVTQIAATWSCLTRDVVFALMAEGVLPYFVCDARGTRRIPTRAVKEYVAGLFAAYRQQQTPQ